MRTSFSGFSPYVEQMSGAILELGYEEIQGEEKNGILQKARFIDSKSFIYDLKTHELSGLKGYFNDYFEKEVDHMNISSLKGFPAI
jgi:hypothetical protein